LRDSRRLGQTACLDASHSLVRIFLETHCFCDRTATLFSPPTSTSQTFCAAVIGGTVKTARCKRSSSAVRVGLRAGAASPRLLSWVSRRVTAPSFWMSKSWAEPCRRRFTSSTSYDSVVEHATVALAVARGPAHPAEGTGRHRATRGGYGNWLV